LQSSQEWVAEGVQQSNTNADHRDRVQQTSDNEQFGLQLWHQFWLTCRSFQEFAAQNGETQSGTDSGQADDDSAARTVMLCTCAIRACIEISPKI
jgi:hypothetical protein